MSALPGISSLEDKPVYLQMQVYHVTVCLQVVEFLDV